MILCLSKLKSSAQIWRWNGAAFDVNEDPWKISYE
jgi:hypothetical protein